MKSAFIAWIVGSALTCHAVLTDSRSVLSVPPMSAAPVVDGCVSVREWTDAALLPALGRLPGGASDRHDTKIYVGWQGAELYLAVASPRAPQATADVTGQESQPDQETNFVELTLKPASGETRRLRLSGKADGLQCRGRATIAGWEAETKIPFASLGGRGEYELEAVLHEPSLGLVSPPLKQRLTVGDVPMACRFTEAGEFRGGKWQGAELEMIFAGTTDVPATVTLILKHGDVEINRVKETPVTLRPNSNMRWRVTMPLTAGEYRAEYVVQAAGTMLARGDFRFEAGGPLRVELQPFFLWREGIFVRVEVLGHKVCDVTLQLQDAKGRKTYQRVSLKTGDDGKGEGFLSSRGVPPGAYLVRVEVDQGGQLVAYQNIPWLGKRQASW